MSNLARSAMTARVGTELAQTIILCTEHLKDMADRFCPVATPIKDNGQMLDANLSMRPPATRWPTGNRIHGTC